MDQGINIMCADMAQQAGERVSGAVESLPAIDERGGIAPATRGAVSVPERVPIQCRNRCEGALAVTSPDGDWGDEAEMKG